MRKQPPVFLVLIFHLSGFSVVWAQSIELLPVRFALFPTHYPVLNPALVNMKNPRSLAMGTQLTAGGFESVYSFYLNGALTIFPDGRPNQRLGITVMGDWEGELISRSWLSLMYAIEIPVAGKVRIGSGAHIGLVNYMVQNTVASPGGSDMAPVISVGLKVRDDRGHIGFAFNQTNRPTLVPIEQPVRLNRHVNLTSDYNFQMSRMFVLTPALWVRWLRDDYREYTFSLEAMLDDIFSFQTLWFHQRNLTFGFGMKNIRFAKTNLRIQFSYTVPFGTEVFDQFKLYEAHIGLNDF